MNTIAIAVAALLATAVGAGLLVHPIVASIEAFHPEAIPASVFMTFFAGLIAYCALVHTEAMKLSQNPALSRQAADRVYTVAVGIRNRAISGFVYLLAAAVLAGVAGALSDEHFITKLRAFSIYVGLAAVAIAVLVWLISKHFEINRFTHRVEQMKRSEEARKKTLDELKRDRLTPA